MALDRTVTDLLFVARIKHLRSTIEQLPVGIIKVDQTGLIICVDEWTATLLGVERSKLRGQSIATIFSDQAEPCLNAIRRRAAGYLGTFTITTQADVKLPVQVAMARSPQLESTDLQIIYSTEI